jgi:hypothetical protein
VLECVNEIKLSEINDSQWNNKVKEAVSTLVGQSTHRNDIDSDFNEITWPAEVIVEANILKLDLLRLNQDQAADIFREHFLHCFGVEQVYIHNRRRVTLTHDFVRDSR